MSFRPAFLIPNYRHGRMLPQTIAGLRAFNLPILIVDDGSGEQDAAVLAMLAEQANTEVIYLPQNGGKGHAVKAGLRALYQQGYSHAFQIDADGQHDQSVVPAFLRAAETHPAQIICGAPQYDDKAPKSRLYGRQITNFWVAVETWSRKISDAMCGFRVYPLQATEAVLSQHRLGDRMDFDIEMLVHLYWLGCDMSFLPIQVDYPEAGISHFKALRDNLLISWAHTRLFFGMLWRTPHLLARLFSRNDAHWSAQKERGSMFGIKLLFTMYKLFGRGFFRLCLYPVMAYYVTFNRAGREASLDFLERVARIDDSQVPKQPGRRQVFKHFMQFGEAVLDKISAWRGELSYQSIRFRTELTMQQVVSKGQGALLIGSHLGNLEVVRALATKTYFDKITGVFFTEHAQKFSEYLKQQNPEVAKRMVEVSDMGVDTAMRLQERIDQGELLVIVGDRTPVHSKGRVEWVDFLGSPAPFPQGPFILASVLQCPVYLFFCWREGEDINVFVEPFAERIGSNRRERAKAVSEAIKRYASRLEHYALKAPYQWFNFFHFWGQAERPSPKPPLVEHHHGQ